MVDLINYPLVFKSSKPNYQTIEIEPAASSDSNEIAQQGVAVDNIVPGLPVGGAGGGVRPVQGPQATIGKKDKFWILW